MGACTGTTKNHTKSLKNSQVTLDSESLTCSICALDYDLADRSPIMLCINQHNACKSCVQHFRNEVTVNCPFCREEMSIKLAGKNRILMEILNEKQIKTATTIKREETHEEKVERILQSARQNKMHKVIYLIEVGADLANVRELHLWNLSLRSIVDFSLFANLRTLDLHKNMISEIQNLHYFTELTYLNLGYNQITQICNMQNLQKLEFLDLCHNQISKIQNLSLNKALATLNLNYNAIKVIQNLYLLPKLTILYIKFNDIELQPNSASIQALQDRGVILEVTPTY